MEEMFRNCSDKDMYPGISSSLTDPGIFDLCMNKWDVSGVQNMSRMFVDCSLSKWPNLNVWDTHTVTDMSGMFASLYGDASQNFNKDINNWDVSNVTDMTRMFYRDICFNAGQTFGTGDNLNNWYPTHVKNFNYMFYDSSFTCDIIQWPSRAKNITTGGVGVDITGMFGGSCPYNWDNSNNPLYPGMSTIYSVGCSRAYDLSLEFGNNGYSKGQIKAAFLPPFDTPVPPVDHFTDVSHAFYKNIPAGRPWGQFNHIYDPSALQPPILVTPNNGYWPPTWIKQDNDISYNKNIYEYLTMKPGPSYLRGTAIAITPAQQQDNYNQANIIGQGGGMMSISNEDLTHFYSGPFPSSAGDLSTNNIEIYGNFTYGTSGALPTVSQGNDYSTSHYFLDPINGSSASPLSIEWFGTSWTGGKSKKGPKEAQYMFTECDISYSLAFNEYLDVSRCTNMSGMFNKSRFIYLADNQTENMLQLYPVNIYDRSTKGNGTLDISKCYNPLQSWNTERCESMAYMFNDASMSFSLSTLQNDNSWNMSKVTDLSYMFTGSWFTWDISMWGLSGGDFSPGSLYPNKPLDASAARHYPNMLKGMCYNTKSAVPISIPELNIDNSGIPLYDICGNGFLLGYNLAGYNYRVNSEVSDFSYSMLHDASLGGWGQGYIPNLSISGDWSHMFHTEDGTPYSGMPSNKLYNVLTGNAGPDISNNISQWTSLPVYIDTSGVSPNTVFNNLTSPTALNFISVLAPYTQIATNMSYMFATNPSTNQPQPPENGFYQQDRTSITTTGSPSATAVLVPSSSLYTTMWSPPPMSWRIKDQNRFTLNSWDVSWVQTMEGMFQNQNFAVDISGFASKISPSTNISGFFGLTGTSDFQMGCMQDPFSFGFTFGSNLIKKGHSYIDISNAYVGGWWRSKDNSSNIYVPNLDNFTGSDFSGMFFNQGLGGPPRYDPKLYTAFGYTNSSDGFGSLLDNTLGYIDLDKKLEPNFLAWLSPYIVRAQDLSGMFGSDSGSVNIPETSKYWVKPGTNDYLYLPQVGFNSWDVGNVTNMHGMFRNATLAYLSQQHINDSFYSWNVSNVTDFSGMFMNTEGTIKILPDGSNSFGVDYWNLRSATTLNNMFNKTKLGNGSDHFKFDQAIYTLPDNAYMITTISGAFHCENFISGGSTLTSLGEDVSKALFAKSYSISQINQAFGI